MESESREDHTGDGDDLRLENISKRFGSMVAVDDLTLTIPAGSFFALLGPSGCGKTTTLRMVGGIELPTTGRIHLGATDLTSRKPYQRPVNTVFQSYALFPHLTVFENVAFGLRRRRQKEVATKVKEALEMVELGALGDRKPTQLSGGQQQRVALARALVNRPQVLLLDEPLGALDLKLRRQMEMELGRIQHEVGSTFVHVTHDQEEAMAMADTIAVMNEGRVEQLGDPVSLYEQPATVFVANFLGQSNLLGAVVTGRDGEDLLLDVSGVRLVLPESRRGASSDRLWVGIRPEKLSLTRHSRWSDPDAAGQPGVPAHHNQLPATVTDAIFIGVSTQYRVVTAWGQALAVFSQNLGGEGTYRPGDQVIVHWAPANAFGLDGGQDAHAGEVIDPELPGAAAAAPAVAGSGSGA
jgi:spermidine/putrescine transport system ATP-binding protein